MNTQLVIDDHLDAGYFERNLRDDVLGGLGVAPGEQKSLPPKWFYDCLLYTSPSPRDKRQSRMPSSA